MKVKKLVFVLLSCLSVCGCGIQTDVKTEYMSELSKYVSNSDSIVLNEETVAYSYETDQGDIKTLEIDTSNLSTQSAEEDVKRNVAYILNERAADEIISIASEVENSNKVNGIAVHLAKNDHGDFSDLENDHLEELDLSGVKLEDMSIESIYKIDNAMFRILIDANMTDEEFEDFSYDLKYAIIEKYGKTFSFSVGRI